MGSLSAMQERTGILLLVSGPSGSGKTTLCERLERNGEAYYATSCTTRAPRKGEIHGEDYFFLSKDDFSNKISTDSFLEYAEVHGHFYGTLKSEVVDKLQQGQDVVMDIDVQGADSVRDCKDKIIEQALVDIFVTPPSEEELRNRLVGRNTDSEEIITTRMKNSLKEMAYSDKYTFLLVSSDKESDYLHFSCLLFAERLRQNRITHS